MRLMISLLTAGLLVACGDKEPDDTAIDAEEVAEEAEEETEAEDSAAEVLEDQSEK